MTEQELLQAMRSMLKEELGPIHQQLAALDQRMDALDQRMERLEESQEEVRDCVNALLEWSEKVSEANRFPLPRM